MMNVALDAGGEADVALILAVGGGFVELGLRPARRSCTAAGLGCAQHPPGPRRLVCAERG